MTERERRLDDLGQHGEAWGDIAQELMVSLPAEVKAEVCKELKQEQEHRAKVEKLLGVTRRPRRALYWSFSRRGFPRPFFWRVLMCAALYRGRTGHADAEGVRDDFEAALDSLHKLRRALDRFGISDTGHICSAIRKVDEKRTLTREETGVRL